MASLGQEWRVVQRRLEAAGLEPAPREGSLLVAQVLGLGEKELLRQEEGPFPTARMDDLQALVARRIGGEPLAYVLGWAPFWSRDWKVGPDVLIPRPDSEILLSEVLERVDGTMRVAEVGVGSGCLIGSVLLERPEVRAVGTDISARALAVAEENLREAGVVDRCELRRGSLLAGAEGAFDLIFSNPPYIADDEWGGLDESVRGFEPEVALRAGVEGLDVYRALIPEAWAALEQGGWLCLEIGWLQGEAVAGLLQAQGFGEVAVVKDLGERDRVALGVKP